MQFVYCRNFAQIIVFLKEITFWFSFVSFKYSVINYPISLYFSFHSDFYILPINILTNGSFVVCRLLILCIFCLQTLINTAYCSLILLGKFIQRLVFGELRVSEQQHLKDKFWNFVFYKFIFVFGVINVQYMDEVVMWCAWFSLLGSLHLLAQLCKDRFEYVSKFLFV